MASVVVDAGERRPEIFSNNFWGKEEAGFEALTSRLREAKQTCEDVRNMFHERAIIEEEYAKRLMRISKITIGNDETGTLREALEVCRQELEATAKEHISLSQKIRTELEQDVTHFIARQKETRKLQQAIVEKSLRNKKEQLALVQKAKEKYETECVKITGLLAGKNSIMGKDLEKLNLKIEKTQMAAKAADQEYAQLVKTAREMTQKWNYDWRIACDKFQDLEEERIDSLKTYLWTYANLISTVCVADDESCERIRVALEHCNVEKDIQIFIRDRATGPDIPEPPNYVNFYEGPKENGVSYKRASFNRVPAYIDGGTTTSLDPSRRLSLHELQSTYNSNGKNNNAYHTRNDSGDYDNMNIERARLYANTTLNTMNNNNNEGEEVIEQTGEEEPVDPRAKQMLSIGDNVFEVETNKLVGQDEIAQALANMNLVTETNNITNNNSDQNLASTITSAINSSVIGSLKNIPINTSTGGSISGEGNSRRPLPINFTEKPQPPTPTDIQQQQTSNILYHQRNNSHSRLPFNSYQLNGSPTAITPTNNTTVITNVNSNTSSINSSTHSLHQQPQGGIINGPGDLRRQPSEYNNNGPVSSQQQQISQNMSMRSKSSQPNRDSQQQQGPGDIRRMSNTQPSPTNTGFTQSPQQMQGQMISQDQILTQGQRQIIPQETTSPLNNNSVNLNRSDTQHTNSTISNNSTIGIQLDIHGRVKKDDLAEAFITNGGRLPPESAKFQTNPQGISQSGQQTSSQGQIPSFNRSQLQQMSSNQPVITPQSSYRGSQQQILQQQQIQQVVQQQQQQIQQAVQQQQQQIQQQIQQQQIQQQVVQQQQILQQPLHRTNTLNSNSTLTSAFHHNQGVNTNPQQLQDSLGIQLRNSSGVQQQQQPLVGQQINYQDPNFYSPPIMAQYQRPPIGATNIGSGASAQGFQQMQHVQGVQLQRQQSQLQSYTGLQQPQQIMARSVQLQYQPLQRPVIAGHPQDNRPRTEDGKPIEFYVKALYDYQKTIPEEISFTAGDVIAVLNTHSDGWWEGEILDETRRNRGLFPSNYIEVLR